MKCPCCQRSLHVGFDLQENAFVAWCGHGGFGPCRSIKANSGAFGRSEEQAQLNLIALLEKNPDWSDEQPEDQSTARLDAADHKYQIEKDDL